MVILYFLLLLFVVAPTGTIIHEGGHFLGAKLVGADYVTCVIGRGNTIFSFTKKNTSITFGLFFFITGSTESFRRKPYTNEEKAFITMCGPLNNLLFIIVFWFIFLMYSSEIMLLFVLYNGWMGIVNLIPFRIKDRKSDGYILWKMLFN